MDTPVSLAKGPRRKLKRVLKKKKTSTTVSHNSSQQLYQKKVKNAINVSLNVSTKSNVRTLQANNHSLAMTVQKLRKELRLAFDVNIEAMRRNQDLGEKNLELKRRLKKLPSIIGQEVHSRYQAKLQDMQSQLALLESNASTFTKVVNELQEQCVAMPQNSVNTGAALSLSFTSVSSRRSTHLLSQDLDLLNDPVSSQDRDPAVELNGGNALEVVQDDIFARFQANPEMLDQGRIDEMSVLMEASYLGDHPVSPAPLSQEYEDIPGQQLDKLPSHVASRQTTRLPRRIYVPNLSQTDQRAEIIFPKTISDQSETQDEPMFSQLNTAADTSSPKNTRSQSVKQVAYLAAGNSPDETLLEDTKFPDKVSNVPMGLGRPETGHGEIVCPFNKMKEKTSALKKKLEQQKKHLGKTSALKRKPAAKRTVEGAAAKSPPLFIRNEFELVSAHQEYIEKVQALCTDNVPEASSAQSPCVPDEEATSHTIRDMELTMGIFDEGPAHQTEPSGLLPSKHLQQALPTGQTSCEQPHELDLSVTGNSTFKSHEGISQETGISTLENPSLKSDEAEDIFTSTLLTSSLENVWSAKKKQKGESKPVSSKSQHCQGSGTDCEDNDSDQDKRQDGASVPDAVTMRVSKGGTYKFTVGRKGADGSRLDVPPLVRARSKPKKAQKLKESAGEQSEQEAQTIFDFHDKTPKSLHSNQHQKSMSVFSLSADESNLSPMGSLDKLRQASKNSGLEDIAVDKERKDNQPADDAVTSAVPASSSAGRKSVRVRSKSVPHSSGKSRKRSKEEEEDVCAHPQPEQSRNASNIDTCETSKSRSRSRKKYDEKRNTVDDVQPLPQNSNTSINKKTPENSKTVSRSRSRSRRRCQDNTPGVPCDVDIPKTLRPIPNRDLAVTSLVDIAGSFVGEVYTAPLKGSPEVKPKPRSRSQSRGRQGRSSCRKLPVEDAEKVLPPPSPEGVTKTRSKSIASLPSSSVNDEGKSRGKSFGTDKMENDGANSVSCSHSLTKSPERNPADKKVEKFLSPLSGPRKCRSPGGGARIRRSRPLISVRDKSRSPVGTGRNRSEPFAEDTTNKVGGVSSDASGRSISSLKSKAFGGESLQEATRGFKSKPTHSGDEVEERSGSDSIKERNDKLLVDVDRLNTKAPNSLSIKERELSLRSERIRSRSPLKPAVQKAGSPVLDVSPARKWGKGILKNRSKSSNRILRDGETLVTELGVNSSSRTHEAMEREGGNRRRRERKDNARYETMKSQRKETITDPKADDGRASLTSVMGKEAVELGCSSDVDSPRSRADVGVQIRSSFADGGSAKGEEIETGKEKMQTVEAQNELDSQISETEEGRLSSPTAFKNTNRESRSQSAGQAKNYDALKQVENQTLEPSSPLAETSSKQRQKKMSKSTAKKKKRQQRDPKKQDSPCQDPIESAALSPHHQRNQGAKLAATCTMQRALTSPGTKGNVLHGNGCVEDVETSQSGSVPKQRGSINKKEFEDDSVPSNHPAPEQDGNVSSPVTATNCDQQRMLGREEPEAEDGNEAIKQSLSPTNKVPKVSKIVKNSTAIFSFNTDPDSISSQSAEGRKRRTAKNISYVAPALNSKLRRGDPFTSHYATEQITIYKSPRSKAKQKADLRRDVLGPLHNLAIKELE